MDDVSIGEALREARGIKTQEQVAEATGVPQDQISRIESGERGKKLVDYLDTVAAVEDAVDRPRGWVRL